MASRVPRKQIRYAQVLLTYPQCDRTKESLLEFIQGIEDAGSAIVCKENHHETDGVHLHAWVRFNVSQRCEGSKWGSLFDWDGIHGHYDKVTCSTRSIADTVKYVMKDGDTLVWNCKPEALMNPGKSHERKYDNEKILNTPMKQLVDEGVISIKDVSAYERGIAAYKLLEKPAEKQKCRGIWVDGRPGCGKSTWAKEFGKARGGWYEKPQSKWWDGYEGEKVVVMNDVDNEALLHYMKIWADTFPCKGEVKGHTVWLKHDWFIVTSNFTIEEICRKKEDGHKFVDAMLRRFRVIHVPDNVEFLQYDNDEWENPDVPESQQPPAKKSPDHNTNEEEKRSDPLNTFIGSGYE
ncbi:REP [Rodent stool-associated circular genome virus]|uniref:Replication-associated protein n=1 Tax=Rodent stool-associated circular genome virus TaxID=1074214 RepID=G1C9G7_9VIRU|nr:REP [Rodent stool-associated circular genome virus]AEM05799.1 REP [Rodent stool-associated circular genome virus]AEM05800.1 REP [Rodent stool-associated circular genome virus]